MMNFMIDCALTAMLSPARNRSIHPTTTPPTSSTFIGVKGRMLADLAYYGNSFPAPRLMH
jgi:hypothetical protein